MDRDHGVELSWVPTAGLTATACEALVKAVARIPLAWLLAPREGELFDSPDEVYARLQGFTLGVGFVVIKGQAWGRTIAVSIIVQRPRMTASCLSR